MLERCMFDAEVSSSSLFAHRLARIHRAAYTTSRISHLTHLTHLDTGGLSCFQKVQVIPLFSSAPRKSFPGGLSLLKSMFG